MKVVFKLILVIDGWGISCEIALRLMSLDLPDDKSTLVQVMAWCHQATSHYLSQCWPRSMPPYGVTRPQWVNTLMPQQSDLHLADNIFTCTFFDKRDCILISNLTEICSWLSNCHFISIGSGYGLVLSGNKLLPEPVMIKFISPWTKWLPFSRWHFKMHFHEWKVLYFDSKFTEVCSIDNKSALVQVMAWHRTGDKPLPEPMLTQFINAYMRH